MTLKLVFLVALTVFAICFSLSDAREMPMGEVNCIGICPPNDPGCRCMPLATAPAPMDDARKVFKETIKPPPSYVTPTPPQPMNDAREMSKETIMHFPSSYVKPPPPLPMMQDN